MQECQITYEIFYSRTALVHTLIEKGRPSQTPESRPKINLPM